MILTAAIVVQIGLAGYGAFYAAHKLEDEGSTINDETFMDGFGLHAGFGYIVILLGLIFMIIGLVAGIGKWRLGRHGLLFLLLFIQLWLAWIGFELPFPVGFLHPHQRDADPRALGLDRLGRVATPPGRCGHSAGPSRGDVVDRGATPARSPCRRRRGTAY